MQLSHACFPDRLAFMIWRVGIGASSLVSSSESWMNQMDFSRRLGRCPLLMKLVGLTCGGSAVTTGPLHSFIQATQWAIRIGSTPADRRRGLWVPGSCECITPTSQINSLELLFSQTPGMAGEDPARSPFTLCPFKPSFGDLLGGQQKAVDYLRKTQALCSPKSDIMSAVYLRLWDASFSWLPFKISWTLLGNCLNCSFRLNGGDIPSLNRLIETPAFPGLCWTEWS